MVKQWAHHDVMQLVGKSTPAFDMVKKLHEPGSAATAVLLPSAVAKSLLRYYPLQFLERPVTLHEDAGPISKGLSANSVSWSSLVAKGQPSLHPPFSGACSFTWDSRESVAEEHFEPLHLLQQGLLHRQTVRAMRTSRMSRSSACFIPIAPANKAPTEAAAVFYFYF